jgi:hypothetical protein
MKKFLLVLSLLPFLTTGIASPYGEGIRVGESESSDQGSFPITVDFSCPKSIGLHIGDEIPLRMTLEARNGVILDLVNLPRKNDTHGPFEGGRPSGIHGVVSTPVLLADHCRK